MDTDMRTPLPLTGTVADIDDATLLRRAVLNARAADKLKHPRWHAVMQTFGLGSTYAAQLCKRFDINPDEMVKR